MMNDPLASVLSKIMNAEVAGKEFCIAKPASKLIKNVLEILKREGYVEDFEILEDRKGGIVKVKLSKKINKIGAIKPRFSVENEEFEKYEKRFLPAKDFGVIIVSTSKGIITHHEAKEKALGGRLLSYCY